MPVISFKNRKYKTRKNESVLDALLRNEVDVPYSCRAGVCNVCMMLSKKNNLPEPSTRGLRYKLVEQGYFLSCQCIPTEDLIINEENDPNLFSEAIIIEKEILSDNLCRIRLDSSVKLDYRAGQYINLRIPNGQIRSYSLASLPAEDDFLELHIKRMKGGAVSNWLFSESKLRFVLELEGPFGECYYSQENRDRNILMISTGSGLAPQLGVIRDAIHNGHEGQISLYHGERFSSDLYLIDFLKNIASRYKNIHYFPCAIESSKNFEKTINQCSASELAFENNKDLKNKLIYLCGSPQMVNSARKQAYLCGAAMKDIFADPFITKDLRLGKKRD